MRRSTASVWEHAASSSCMADVLTTASRSIHKGVFIGEERLKRLRNTHTTTAMFSPNYYGGRFARFREYRRHRRTFGKRLVQDPAIVQFNMDVWNAQQTLRKKWKARDWEVVEMPFELAPRVLQRVVPEMYTEMPQSSDAVGGDHSNVRRKVFDREDLQRELFTSVTAEEMLKGRDPAGVLPYPPIRRVDRQAPTLDKFL